MGTAWSEVWNQEREVGVEGESLTKGAMGVQEAIGSSQQGRDGQGVRSSSFGRLFLPISHKLKLPVIPQMSQLQSRVHFVEMGMGSVFLAGVGFVDACFLPLSARPSQRT